MSTQSQKITYEAINQNGTGPKTGLTVTFDLLAETQSGYNVIEEGLTMSEDGKGVYSYLYQIDSKRNYVALFNANTTDLYGNQYRHGHIGNTNSLIEDFKLTVTSHLGVIGRRVLTDEEIIRIIKEMKVDKELAEILSPKLNDRSEEIIKLIQSTGEGLKTLPVDYEPRFINLLESHARLEEKIDQRFNNFEILGEILEELPERTKESIEPRFTNFLENIPERVIENTDKVDMLNIQFQKTLDFIETGNATNNNKLNQIRTFLKKEINA